MGNQHVSDSVAPNLLTFVYKNPLYVARYRGGNGGLHLNQQLARVRTGGRMLDKPSWRS